LDSSSIASVVATDYGEVPFKTFSIYYDGEGQMDERPWIREVLNAYPHIQPFYYSPTEEDVAKAFEHAVTLHDVPIPMSPPISCYFVMQLASRNKMKVMLDGQGADEYLGGYSPSLYRLVDWSSIGFDNGPEFDGMKAGGSRLKQYLLHLMFSNPLPSLLHYGDRMSMAFSIEGRVPFLDHRLVEFVHSLDDESIIFKGIPKYILRSALGKLLPAAIVGRKNKQPFFGGEAAVWLRGPLRNLSDAHFDFDRLRILDADKVGRLVSEFRGGDNSRATTVWKLGTLNYWAQRQ